MSCARGRDAGVRQKLAAQVVRRKSPNEICCYRCRCARALRDGDACRAVAGRQAIRAIAGRARGDEQRHVCVELPPLRCAVGYATALHDITHIVLSYSRDDDPGGMSVRKSAAKCRPEHRTAHCPRPRAGPTAGPRCAGSCRSSRRWRSQRLSASMRSLISSARSVASPLTNV